EAAPADQHHQLVLQSLIRCRARHCLTLSLVEPVCPGIGPGLAPAAPWHGARRLRNGRLGGRRKPFARIAIGALTGRILAASGALLPDATRFGAASRAQMAELVDAPSSGGGARKGVEVRVLFWAPVNHFIVLFLHDKVEFRKIWSHIGSHILRGTW